MDLGFGAPPELSLRPRAVTIKRLTRGKASDERPHRLRPECPLVAQSRLDRPRSQKGAGRSRRSQS
jgi:hypothetical protein